MRLFVFINNKLWYFFRWVLERLCRRGWWGLWRSYGCVMVAAPWRCCWSLCLSVWSPGSYLRHYDQTPLALAVANDNVLVVLSFLFRVHKKKIDFCDLHLYIHEYVKLFDNYSWLNVRFKRCCCCCSFRLQSGLAQLCVRDSERKNWIRSVDGRPRNRTRMWNDHLWLEHSLPGHSAYHQVFN